MKIFKKKLEKYIDINPDNEQIRETNTKLMMIFPNSHISFKLELNSEFVGVYIDNLLMSVQKIEVFNWNMTWIDVVSKLESLKSQIDNPEIYVGELVLPKKIN